MHCEICNIDKDFSVGYSLAKHINTKHKEISVKEYYDKFILKDNKNKCIICGNEARFDGIDNGYFRTCSNSKCNKKARRIPTEKKEIEKNIKCQICGSMHPTNRALSTHFSHLHKISVHDYYMQFIYNGEDLKCPICGERKKFENLSVGFKNTCGKKECYDIIKLQSTKKYFENHGYEGVTNTFQLPETVIKIKQTKKEKTGDENYNNRQKAITTCNERYQCDNTMQIKEVREKAWITRYKNIYLNRIAKIKKFSTPLFNKIEADSNYLYEWKCNDCSKIFKDKIRSFSIPRCPNCFPVTKGKSIYEKEIFVWLKDLGILSEVNKRFYYDKSKFHEIDIYIENKKFGVEIDGLYWHSEITGNKNNIYHITKTNFFKENHNIDIIHVFDFEWLNKKDIVKSMILSKLGIYQNKIFARKCELKVLNDNKVVKEFLDNNHIQGSINSSIKLGLFYDDELVSLMTFGKSRYNSGYEYEMLRFCNKLNITIVGGFSKLLSFFKNNISKSLITYCDRRFSNGDVYLKNNFKLLNISYPNYFYTKNYIELESRIKYQKHKLSNILSTFDSTLTEWENMQLNGFDRIWDCGNFVFCLI